MNYKALFFLLLMIQMMSLSFAQVNAEPTVSKDSSALDTTNSRSITAFPVLFYLPETSLSFGALGITTFNIGKETSWRPSQFQLAFAYTLKKQVLIFTPYELYYKQKWKMEGELGYYKYFYNYYGIGPNSKKENLAFFDADFPRIINTLSYRLTPTNFIGIRTHLDAFKIKNPDSLLLAEAPVGMNGGTIFSLGLTYNLDTRDNIFYPRKGVYVNFISEFSSDGLISDFNYGLFQVSGTYYKELAKNHILASNLTTSSIVGDAPFFAYPYLSSSKLARGHADRRFIDKNSFVLQSEYRFPIYKRLRGAVFGALGNVESSYDRLFATHPKLSGGAGLRFQLNKKVMNHIRLDVAGSREGVQFYVTFGESF